MGLTFIRIVFREKILTILMQKRKIGRKSFLYKKCRMQYCPVPNFTTVLV